MFSYLFVMLAEAAEVTPQVQTATSGGDYAWVIGGVVTILSALTAAIVSIIHAAKGNKRNEKRIVSENILATKTDKVAEKVDTNLGLLKKELDAANRHIKQQEMLLMVLLNREGLADIQKPAVTLPPEEPNTVIVNGAKYKLVKIDNPKAD